MDKMAKMDGWMDLFTCTQHLYLLDFLTQIRFLGSLPKRLNAKRVGFTVFIALHLYFPSVVYVFFIIDKIYK